MPHGTRSLSTNITVLCHRTADAPNALGVDLHQRFLQYCHRAPTLRLTSGPRCDLRVVIYPWVPERDARTRWLSDVRANEARLIGCCVGKQSSIISPICERGGHCIACFDRRLEIAWNDPATRVQLSLEPVRLTLQVIAATLLEACLGACGVQRDPPGPAQATSVDHATGRGRLHLLTPVSECNLCRNGREHQMPHLIPTRGGSQNTTGYRARAGEQLRDQLFERLVDPVGGFVRAAGAEDRGTHIVGWATAPTMDADEPTEGWGWGGSVESAAALAIVEALERHAGAAPRGATRLVRASWREISDRAVHPVRHGLPDYRRHVGGGSQYEPFDESCEYEWAWGYSLTARRPVLVLADFVYYGGAFRSQAARKPVAQETSNGCAAGSSIEEAALYALLELIERDAMLLSWYSRRPGTRIHRNEYKDPTARLIVDRIIRRFGYEPILCDITAECGIPAVAALAVNLSGDRERPTVVMSAGAHLEREAAILAALRELVAQINLLLEVFPARRKWAEQLFADGDLISQLQDHPLANSVPQAFARFEPYLSTAGQSKDDNPSAQGMHQPTGKIATTRGALAHVASALSRSGMEVIVVDQTSRELEHVGLRSVKAIVPGLIPITFGPSHVRLSGLSRPADAARRLGMDRLFLEPHPFA